MMGDLTTHFSRREFRYRPADPETPAQALETVSVDWALLDALEELRGFVGRPLYVTRGGGHRPEGDPGSQHRWGRAADVTVSAPGLSGRDLCAWLFTCALHVERFREGGIGIYPMERFVHVDVRGSRARWSRRGAGPTARYAAMPSELMAMEREWREMRGFTV